MAELLTEALIARVADRARDPERRTDAPPSSRGQSIRHGNLSIVGIDVDRFLRGDGDPRAHSPEVLREGARDAAIAAAERRLGRPLPAALVQVLTQIGNGGFGPGPGLAPLSEMIAAWSTFRAQPPSEGGQPWPAELLPLTAYDRGYDCLDMDSGKIILWDEEVLADGGSDAIWRNSFADGAPSLAAWLEAWVGTPSAAETQRAMIDEGVRIAARAMLDYWRGRTPRERADFGLPDTGWERELLKDMPIDPEEL
jgi:SMI1 / KNR4 family (SUKH-1)